MSPYRTPNEPKPLPPDPDIARYAVLAKKHRRRIGAIALGCGLALALAVGALVLLRALRARQMTERWRDVLACVDDATDGFEERIRVRQLAVIGGERHSASAWPARCTEPLERFAHAADDAGQRPLAASANELATFASWGYLANESLSAPVSRLVHDARGIGLGPLAHGSAATEPARILRVDALDALKRDGSCVFADDGKTATCGMPSRQLDARVFGRELRFESSERNAPPLAPPQIDLAGAQPISVLELRDISGVYACDPTCFMEDAGIGPMPRLVTGARLGNELVIVWIDKGPVGGVRMRIGERGNLVNGRTRVIFDDRAPNGFTTRPLENVRLVGRPDHALLFFVSNGEVLVARIDEAGNVARIPIARAGADLVTDHAASGH